MGPEPQRSAVQHASPTGKSVSQWERLGQAQRSVRFWPLACLGQADLSETLRNLLEKLRKQKSHTRPHVVPGELVGLELRLPTNRSMTTGGYVGSRDLGTISSGSPAGHQVSRVKAKPGNAKKIFGLSQIKNPKPQYSKSEAVKSKSS